MDVSLVDAPRERRLCAFVPMRDEFHGRPAGARAVRAALAASATVTWFGGD
jgi:hypothetical protein